MIKKLVEPYPTECFNNGKLVSQKQRIYECSRQDGAATDGDTTFRVTKDTYEYLRNYSYAYNCSNSVQEKQVCVCPQGYFDFSCATQTQTKCFVKVTDPPFYKGC